MQTKQDRDEITRKVWQIVNGLPQREAILEGDARHWVGEVVGEYGELAIWHATRAGGFGGSQIGALVRNHVGQRADHEQSAHAIVEGALLRRLPDEPNCHMRRGIAMEPMHRPQFYAKYGAVRDDKGFATLSKSVGLRPWMRYSPDDLVFMPQGGALRAGRWLIDFKAPSLADQSERVSFQYVCQLHMGRLVCEHNGVPINGLLLSQFDWANWQLKDDQVGYLPQLDDMIIAAGDHYWEYVLRGEVPPYVRRPKLDPDAFGADVRDAAMRMARLKALQTAIEKHVEELDKTVKEALSKHQFGGSALALNGITFTAVPKPDMEKIRAAVPAEVLATVPLKKGKRRYDEDAMAGKLTELGQNLAQFALPGNMDNEALYAALCDAGLDADALMGEQIRGTVDKKLGEEVNAWLTREFADLLQPQSQADGEVDGSTNDRDGHETQRSVPRSVVA